MQVECIKVGSILTNCYIVFDENSKKAAVIDPGDEHEKIIDTINKNCLEVEYIFLTHGHIDHVLGVNGVKEATGAKIVVHKNDLGYLNSDGMKRFTHLSGGRYDTIIPDIVIESESMHFSFGPLNAEYFHTPGHTMGSCVVKVSDCLFTGDTLFKGTCGRCDLPGGNFSKLLISLKKIAEIKGDYDVFPGHESFSTLSEERANNKFIEMAYKK